MAKPINRREQKRNYLFMGIAMYVVILFLACHLNKAAPGSENIVEMVEATMDHIQKHPFGIFPISLSFLARAAFVGLIPPLLLYTEYLRRRDLRPAEENGSAKWNESLDKFYKKYAEMTVAWPKIFRIFPFSLVKRLLTGLDKLLRKIPVIRSIYGWLHRQVSKHAGTLDRTPGTRNMIFTNDIFMSMNGRKTRRNNNVLVIGGSGTGKSRFVVKPNLLQANCSYVITDPSGELLETMGKCLQDMGYEVRVFNLVQMDHSNTYNPFHYIRNQEGVLVMINSLIKNTNPKDSHSSDPFWEKAETALLQACCFYLVSQCSKEDQNFSNVMKLLRCASAVEGQENVDSPLDILFKDVEAEDPEHIACQCYKIFKSAGGGKTAQSILISCQTRLQTFNLDAIKNLTNTDNINLGDIGDKPVALFCTTPTADTTFNYLVALLYTQLFETLYFHAETECKGKRLKHHVRFLLDEFANIGTIPDFSQKLATMRKYEISCTVIIQALSQLKSMYKDDWEVLVGNCDTLLFLGGSDATTLEYVSKKLGKETIRSVNNSRSYGKQGSHSVSYNKTGRELMTPEELGIMDNENCILFLRGEYPFFSTKYKLENHPNYYLSGDANDDNLFEVKDVFHTARPDIPLRDEPRSSRIRRNMERADTRESERQHRTNRRQMQTHSAKGEPLGKRVSLEDRVPVLKEISDVSKMTPEQKAALDKQTDGWQVRSVHNNPEEVDMDRYSQAQIEAVNAFDNVYGVPETEEFFDMPDTSDPERGEE